MWDSLAVFSQRMVTTEGIPDSAVSILPGTCLGRYRNKGPGEAGASGAGMGRRLSELPIAREQSLKVSQDEAVATTGPKARRTTRPSPGQDQMVGGWRVGHHEARWQEKGSTGRA